MVHICVMLGVMKRSRAGQEQTLVMTSREGKHKRGGQNARLTKKFAAVIQLDPAKDLV